MLNKHRRYCEDKNKNRNESIEANSICGSSNKTQGKFVV